MLTALALDVQIRANPQLKQHEPKLRQFFAKYMSWQALQGDFAAIYMNAFTEAHAVQPSLRGSPENR